MTAALVLAAATGAVAAPLTKTERRVTAAVDAHLPASRALLERAVNVNSGTLNLEGVRAVGAMFRPEFDALGFQTRWVDGAAWGRAGHLIATRAGRPGSPHVLLIGHLDTVFEADSPFQRYQALGDTAAHGPGVCDMKGGDVVMLLALRALKDAQGLDRLTLTAVLTGDEEKSGTPLALARKDLLDAARGCEVAIGFEDGPGDPRVGVIGRRGSSDWVLRVAGKPAHSSQIFRDEVGAGAIYEAARILNAFRDSLSAEPNLTFNPGAIVGGTQVSLDPGVSRGTAFGKSNVIAESTLATGDLRALSMAQREAAKAAMGRIVGAHLPHTSATIEFRDGYPPLSPRDGSRKLLARWDQVSRDLGFGPVTESDPRKAGAADISFTDPIVPAALDGVGLMGTGGHTVEETADLRTLPENAKRVAVLLWRLAGGK